MEKVASPSGSMVNFESLVQKIQEKSFLNLLNRIKIQYPDGGIFNPAVSFSVTVNSTNITVGEGFAITANGEYLYSDVPTNKANPTTAAPNIAVAIYMQYYSLGTTPVKAVNSFVYDKIGSQSLNRNTEYSDSFTIVLRSVSANVIEAAGASEVLLGVLWNSTGTFVPADAELTGTLVSSGVYRFYDLRDQYPLYITEEVLDPSKVFFKDRAQTVSSQVDFEAKIVTPRVDISSEKPIQLYDGKIASSTGTHLQFIEDSGVSAVSIPILKTSSLKVNVGSNELPIWQDVATLGPSPSVPRNLRIYDIYPTEDYNEKKGYVEVKWNWDELVIAHAGADYFAVTKLNYNNEIVLLSQEDMETYLPGKKFYLPAQDIEYVINSVAEVSGLYRFYVDASPNGHRTAPGNGARIVDVDVQNYALRFTATRSSDSRTRETLYHLLDATYAYEASFVQKLEIGKEWHCTIQGINNNSFSPTITMPAGSYDPDHAASGQAITSYSSPFMMELPEITASGNFTLSPNLSGFTVSISGFTAPSDIENSAQEWEIIWSSTDALTQESFNDLTSVQRMVSKTRLAHIPSDRPTKYSVAIRPLQNKQGVGPAVIKEVVSGGGGVAPQEQILFDDVISVETYRALSYGQRSELVLRTRFFSDLSGEEEVLSKELIRGKYAVIPIDTAFVDNFSTDLNYTSSSLIASGQMDVSFITGGAPYPKYINFSVSALTFQGSDIYDTESSWAKVETGSQTVQPNEKIHFSATATMFN